MWIILPLIYVLSWRSYRRFGQAFSETAAWVAGYLAGTGILLALHAGGVSLITATPDDPMAIFAIIGGFVGMGISRWLWKRRGGHLEPAWNPWVDSRWLRAARAMFKPSKKKRSKKAVARSQVTVQRSSSQAVSKPRPTVKTAAPAARPRTGKSSAERWGRVLGAMMTPSDSHRPPRQQ